MSNQTRLLRKRVLLLLMFFAGVIGCDRTTRYKVLTFFFEGVPSPDAKYIQSKPKDTILSSADRLKAVKSANVLVLDSLGQRRSSRHSIAKDCAQCHAGDLRSGRQELKTLLPKLCYSCHTDLYQESDYLHGPINVGECVFCHEPHQSAYVHLQKAPEPQLCYRCHQREDIATIPDHPEYLEKVCTDCHNPHGSPVPHLLKVDRQEQTDPDGVDINEIQPDFGNNSTQEIVAAVDFGFESIQIQEPCIYRLERRTVQLGKHFF
ncbi:MAG: hypothetical protein OEV87_07940 [Phycisphaerae bacterium]|nr:hypothetical protein [Phycisphaerae bacterium]